MHSFSHDCRLPIADSRLIVRLDPLVKRNLELIEDVLICGIVKDVKSVADFFGIVIDECSEEAVPDGKDVAVVGVGPGALIVVMKFVHVRRDEDVAQRFVKPSGEVDVRVGEVGEEYRTNPVEEVERKGGACDDDREQRK